MPEPSKIKKKKGGRLSIDRFSRAKLSTYDPRKVKEEQRARAAITIAKYKKLKKRLGRVDGQVWQRRPTGMFVFSSSFFFLLSLISTTSIMQNPNDAAIVAAAVDNNNDPNDTDSDADHRHRRETNKNKHVEKVEELERQKEAEAAKAAAEKAEKGAALKRRKQEHKLFRKKTHHGQPVMKHRIEKLLHQLEGK